MLERRRVNALFLRKRFLARSNRSTSLVLINGSRSGLAVFSSDVVAKKLKFDDTRALLRVLLQSAHLSTSSRLVAVLCR